MKKICSSIALLFAVATVTNAQNTSPYWSLVGNTNATASSKIGTVNSVPLRFVTKNLDRIRIDTFGRVGIGTITPVQVLHVVGNGTLTGNFGIGTTAPSQKLYVVGNSVITGNLGVGVTPTQKLHVKGNGVFTGNVGVGTTSPSYKLYVKGTTNASQLVIDAYSTQSNSQPLIRLRNSAGTDLLHIHSDDPSNIFIGLNAGKSNFLSAQGTGLANTFVGSNSGAANTTGNYNTATGYDALYSNNQGYSNTASGYFALYGNTYGHGNAGFGTNALNSNTSGIYNSGFGYASLYSTSTGNYNTACGSAALYDNNGSFNTATGFEALRLNRESYNTAFGYQALRNTVYSQYNVAFGYHAGYSLDNGYNNVFVGANTDVNGIGYYNVIAIGQATVCTSPSQVTMGNSATGSYRAYANWSNISDERYKKNVKENVPGLSFINKLRPVTYNLDATGLDNFLNKSRIDKKEVNTDARALMDKAFKEKENIMQTGFIAQEVEKSAKEIGYDFSGVDAAKNENDIYGLRYAELVVPLVKAVQELSKKQEEIDVLKQEIAELRELVMELKNLKTNNPAANFGAGFLKQNVPNPFNNSTLISYYISDNNNKGLIKITDAKGSILKTYNASPGQGQLSIKSSDLPAGTYYYSLFVNDKKIDTKQMIITR